jgi:pimeloyl-ACP methyl ester carboxylesterase
MAAEDGMAVFVLVHGGSHGGWCWDKVVPLLEADGHRAIAPDLPGMGDDPTPIETVSFFSFAIPAACGVESLGKRLVALVGSQSSVSRS